PLHTCRPVTYPERLVPRRSLPDFVAKQRLLSFPTRRSSDLRGILRHLHAGEAAAGGLPGFRARRENGSARLGDGDGPGALLLRLDRKSTRLNSSHEWSSYAVFCLKQLLRLQEPGDERDHVHA